MAAEIHYYGVMVIEEARLSIEFPAFGDTAEKRRLTTQRSEQDIADSGINLTAQEP